MTKEKSKPETSLSQTVYSADQVKKFEVVAAKKCGVEIYQLMERAGKAVFDAIKQRYPSHHCCLVFAGSGNNGGDAYVAARLAKEAGLDVQLVTLSSGKPRTDDATNAQALWLEAGGQLLSLDVIEHKTDVIVIDGLLGSGVSRALDGQYKLAVEWINKTQSPVVSIDIPSGIHANTGRVCGVAVKADMTVTFVGKKSGSVTGAGRGYCGQLIFDDLDIGHAFENIASPQAQLMSYQQLNPLPKRPDDIYKGQCGKLLCIGSNIGMSGAIRLSGEAALRSGAGLVKVLCHEQSANTVMNGRPELMVSSQIDSLPELFNWADNVIIGPGLGRDIWAQNLLSSLLSMQQKQAKPLILDADALTLLSDMSPPPNLLKNSIITPHAGEAARLLDIGAEDIDKNRYKSAAALAEKFGTLVVLKGAGTIVRSSLSTWVCEDGNPGMATAGMGDLLCGVIGALVANGLPIEQAVKSAVCIHSRAADIVASECGPKGLLASDLFEPLRRLVNF